jgi:hypothetical protein
VGEDRRPRHTQHALEIREGKKRLVGFFGFEALLANFV